MAVPGTARACFFNATALGLGFSVMLASELPMLQRFGGLVASAALASFVIGLIVIPAAYAASLGFLGSLRAWANRSGVKAASVAVLGLGGALLGGEVEAGFVPESAEEGLRVARQVAERAEGDSALRTIEMTLINKRGATKVREAQVLKLQADGLRQTRITYLAPKAVKNTSFLSHDFDRRADDRWLFIPATRKVRRIPASDRGDYFLGTDFTYEDIQSELKFALTDYDFDHRGVEYVDGRSLHRIYGEPKDDKVARELGYGAFDALVDEQSWMPRRIEFFDLRHEPLKTVEVLKLEQVDGIWTATEILASNHDTGHSTRFRYRDIDYSLALSEGVFKPENLQRRTKVLPAGDSAAR